MGKRTLICRHTATLGLGETLRAEKNNVCVVTAYQSAKESVDRPNNCLKVFKTNHNKAFTFAAVCAHRLNHASASSCDRTGTVRWRREMSDGRQILMINSWFHHYHYNRKVGEEHQILRIYARLCVRLKTRGVPCFWFRYAAHHKNGEKSVRPIAALFLEKWDFLCYALAEESIITSGIPEKPLCWDSRSATDLDSTCRWGVQNKIRMYLCPENQIL